MKERIKRYESAGIDKNRYLELKYLARQYDSMRKREAKLRSGEVDRRESGHIVWRQSDPTGNAAVCIAAASMAGKIRAIEEAAHAAGAGIYRELMLNVTRGMNYEVLNPPCGRAQFYRARRMFFVELDRRV